MIDVIPARSAHDRGYEMRALFASGRRAFGRFSGLVKGLKLPPSPASTMAVNSCEVVDLFIFAAFDISPYVPNRPPDLPPPSARLAVMENE